jgi:hypothetical protein
VLTSIQDKSKTLHDIKKKVDLFKECLEFLKEEGDPRVNDEYPDLSNFECEKRLIKMNQIHENTLK